MAATLTRLALALAAALLFEGRAIAQQRVPQLESKTQRFNHRSHLEPGFEASFRQATGAAANSMCTTRCHQFVGNGAADYSSPFDKSCDKCHQPVEPDGKEIPTLMPTPHVGKPKRTNEEVGFHHDSPEHSRHGCLECHPRVKSSEAGDDFVVSRDLKNRMCFDCHSDHNADRPQNLTIKKLISKGDTNQCSICHITGASDAARKRDSNQFLHSDHLTRGKDNLVEGWTNDACARCHGKVADAGPIQPDNYAAFFLGPDEAGESCGKCHRDRPLVVDRDGNPSLDGAVAGLSWERREHAKVAKAASSFSHQMHGPNGKGKKTCIECHTPSAKNEPVSDESYTKCVFCHMPYAVKNHPTATCQRCHEKGVPSSTADAGIATVQRDREDPAGFTMRAHDHPGVTQRGAALPEEHCERCHRGRPAELLRPAPRKFRHASHVVGEVEKSNCRDCHQNVVATADNSFFRAYDDPPQDGGASCVHCHVGSDLSAERKTRTVTVPRFSHRSHLASTIQKLSCEECHKRVAPGVGDGLEFTPVDKLTCKNCHGHVDPKKIEVTGGKVVAQEKKSCAFCHGGDENSKFTQLNFDLERWSGHLIRPRADEPSHQWHDREGGCVNCHALPKLQRIVAPLPPITLASPHGVEKIKYQPFITDHDRCTDCHTKNYGSDPGPAGKGSRR